MKRWKTLAAHVAAWNSEGSRDLSKVTEQVSVRAEAESILLIPKFEFPNLSLSLLMQTQFLCLLF